MAEFQINGININNLVQLVDKTSSYPKSIVFGEDSNNLIKGAIPSNKAVLKPDPSWQWYTDAANGKLKVNNTVEPLATVNSIPSTPAQSSWFWRNACHWSGKWLDWEVIIAYNHSNQRSSVAVTRMSGWATGNTLYYNTGTTSLKTGRFQTFAVQAAGGKGGTGVSNEYGGGGGGGGSACVFTVNMDWIKQGTNPPIPSVVTGLSGTPAIKIEFHTGKTPYDTNWHQQEPVNVFINNNGTWELFLKCDPGGNASGQSGGSGGRAGITGRLAVLDDTTKLSICPIRCWLFQGGNGGRGSDKKSSNAGDGAKSTSAGYTQATVGLPGSTTRIYTANSAGGTNGKYSGGGGGGSWFGAAGDGGGENATGGNAPGTIGETDEYTTGGIGGGGGGGGSDGALWGLGKDSDGGRFGMAAFALY